MRRCSTEIMIMNSKVGEILAFVSPAGTWVLEVKEVRPPEIHGLTVETYIEDEIETPEGLAIGWRRGGSR